MSTKLTPEQANTLNNSACKLLSQARAAARYAANAHREAQAAERDAEENLSSVQAIIREMGVDHGNG